MLCTAAESLNKIAQQESGTGIRQAEKKTRLESQKDADVAGVWWWDHTGRLSGEAGGKRRSEGLRESFAKGLSAIFIDGAPWEPTQVGCSEPHAAF